MFNKGSEWSETSDPQSLASNPEADADAGPAAQATEESARNASFQMFRNQGPEYYGDQDEGDADLLDEEEKAAREGGSLAHFLPPS